MPNFINSNRHHAYVDTGDVQLLKLRPFQTVEEDGRAADALAATPGIVCLDELTKEERAELDQKIADHRLAVDPAAPLGPDALAGSPGADAAEAVAEQAATATVAEGLDERNQDELEALGRKIGVEDVDKLDREELIAKLRELVTTTGEDETPAPPATKPKKAAKPKPAAKLPKAPPKIGKGSDTKSWAKFAKSLGLTFPDDAKRADLFKLVDKHLAKVEKEIAKAEKAGGGTVTSDKVPKKGQ